MTQKTNQNPWTMDVRVRERNLKSGALTDKDLEKHLASLPDLADQAEPFGTAQPALAQQPVVEAPAPAASEPPEEHEEFSAEPAPESAPEPEVQEPAADVGGGSFTNSGEGQES